jgi:hypothetical protein
LAERSKNAQATASMPTLLRGASAMSTAPDTSRQAAKTEKQKNRKTELLNRGTAGCRELRLRRKQ